MLKNKEYYERYYFSKSKPIPYKLNCGYEINIYPILVKDWEEFEDSIDIFNIDKNSIPDPNVIQMNYITFLKKIQFELTNKIENSDITHGQIQSAKFSSIMQMCLKEDYVCIEYDKGKCVVVICENKDNELIIKGKMSNREFEEIKNIILFQNIKDYDDKRLDPTVQKIYNDFLKLKNKDCYIPNLEEQKEYFISKIGWDEEKVNNLTYRRFKGIFECLIGESMYFGNKFIEASYKYQCDKVQNYFLFEKKKDKYDGFIVDGDNIKNKIN